MFGADPLSRRGAVRETGPKPYCICVDPAFVAVLDERGPRGQRPRLKRPIRRNWSLLYALTETYGVNPTRRAPGDPARHGPLSSRPRRQGRRTRARRPRSRRRTFSRIKPLIVSQTLSSRRKFTRITPSWRQNMNAVPSVSRHVFCFRAPEATHVHSSNWRHSRSSTARWIRSKLFHQITVGMLALAWKTGVTMAHSADSR